MAKAKAKARTPVPARAFGKLEDPYGNQWALATHTEDVPPRRMAERARAAMAEMAKGQA
jgi:hypothetical protein